MVGWEGIISVFTGLRFCVIPELNFCSSIVGTLILVNNLNANGRNVRSFGIACSHHTQNG